MICHAYILQKVRAHNREAPANIFDTVDIRKTLKMFDSLFLRFCRRSRVREGAFDTRGGAAVACTGLANQSDPLSTGRGRLHHECTGNFKYIHGCTGPISIV